MNEAVKEKRFNVCDEKLLISGTAGFNEVLYYEVEER